MDGLWSVVVGAIPLFCRRDLSQARDRSSPRLVWRSGQASASSMIIITLLQGMMMISMISYYNFDNNNKDRKRQNRELVQRGKHGALNPGRTAGRVCHPRPAPPPNPRAPGIPQNHLPPPSLLLLLLFLLLFFVWSFNNFWCVQLSSVLFFDCVQPGQQDGSIQDLGHLLKRRYPFFS